MTKMTERNEIVHRAVRILFPPTVSVNVMNVKSPALGTNLALKQVSFKNKFSVSFKSASVHLFTIPFTNLIFYFFTMFSAMRLPFFVLFRVCHDSFVVSNYRVYESSGIFPVVFTGPLSTIFSRFFFIFKRHGSINTAITHLCQKYS